jgi:hypothetical protein
MKINQVKTNGGFYQRSRQVVVPMSMMTYFWKGQSGDWSTRLRIERFDEAGVFHIDLTKEQAVEMAKDILRAYDEAGKQSPTKE